MNQYFLREVKKKKEFEASFKLPVVFNNSITFLTGTNGAGKSTLIEAIAQSFGCNPEGGSKNFNFSTEATHSSLFENFRFVKGVRSPKDIYFFRSDTFYNLISNIRELDRNLSFDPEIKTYYGGKDLHDMSRGEGMLAFIQNRLKPDALYIFDEPESALDIDNLLKFMMVIKELGEQGAQFIIATHSPILIQIKTAEILEFNHVSKFFESIELKDSYIYSQYKRFFNSNYLECLMNDA